MADINFDILKNYKPPKDVESSVDFSILDSKQEQTKESKDNISTLETAMDIGSSATVGAGTGLSYLLDLPQLLQDGLQFGVDKLYSLAGGDINKVKEIRQQLKTPRIEPGKILRENVLTYKPKTKLGEYAFTGGEFAAPGGLLGKTAKAKKLFATTGAGSGLVAQGVEDVSGSEAVGTGAGIGVNIALDLLALRRGNLAAFAKDILPDQTIVDKTVKLQKDSAAKGLNLTAGEASGAKMLQSAESNLAVQRVNNQAVDLYYDSRPQKLETFFKKFASERGLTKDTFTVGTSKSKTADVLKKSAALLQTNRTNLWKRSGGDKFLKLNFDSQEVNNLSITIRNMIEKSNVPSIQAELSQILKSVDRSGGKAEQLHNVYKTVNDLNYTLKGNLNKTANDRLLIAATETIKNDLTKIFSVNADFVKANKKYQAYTRAYFQPLEKLEIFKSLQKSKWTDNMDTVGKLYRVLASDNINPTDITKIAKSFNATGDKTAWRNIVSSYVDNQFLTMQSKSSTNLLNKGLNFYKGLVGTPRQKANTTEMFYQLAKQEGYNVSKADVGKAIEQFAKILRASGDYAKVGSQTAIRQADAETLGRNFISKFLGGSKGGIPIIGTINDFFATRSYSQNSKAIAEAMFSPNGMEELVKLAKNWKDKNASIVYTANIIRGAKMIEETQKEFQD